MAANINESVYGRINISPGTFILSLPEELPVKDSYSTDLTEWVVQTGTLSGPQTRAQLNIPAGIYFAVVETGRNEAVKRMRVNHK